MAEIKPPTNSLVSTLNKVIDFLIKGVATQTVIALAVAEQPWLGWLIINDIFTYYVNKLAASLDLSLKNGIDIVIIRFQNNEIKSDYDKSLKDLDQAIKNGEDHDKALQDAKDAADKLIHRSKP